MQHACVSALACSTRTGLLLPHAQMAAKSCVVNMPCNYTFVALALLHRNCACGSMREYVSCFLCRTAAMQASAAIAHAGPLCAAMLSCCTATLQPSCYLLTSGRKWSSTPSGLCSSSHVCTCEMASEGCWLVEGEAIDLCGVCAWGFFSGCAPTREKCLWSRCRRPAAAGPTVMPSGQTLC